MATVVLSSRESIWGGGEVFLYSLGLVMRERGHIVRWRVPQGSALAARIDPADLISRRRRVKTDLLVANDFRSVWGSILIDRRIDRKFVLHGDWQISPLRAAILERFEAGCFGVSNQVAGAALRAGLKDEVPVLPLGPEYSSTDSPLRTSLPPPIADYVVGGIARWDKVKRLELFCQTVEALNVKGILLVPKPSTVEEHAMYDLVRRYPSVQIQHGNTSAIWSLCDVFLSTSTAESLGLAHLEALAAGKFVLSTAAHGPADYLEGPLAVGRLISSDPLEIAREVDSAIGSVVKKWAEYVMCADRTLRVRGPGRCVEAIMGDLW